MFFAVLYLTDSFFHLRIVLSRCSVTPCRAKEVLRSDSVTRSPLIFRGFYRKGWARPKIKGCRIEFHITLFQVVMIINDEPMGESRNRSTSSYIHINQSFKRKFSQGTIRGSPDYNLECHLIQQSVSRKVSEDTSIESCLSLFLYDGFVFSSDFHSARAFHSNDFTRGKPNHLIFISCLKPCQRLRLC